MRPWTRPLYHTNVLSLRMNSHRSNMGPSASSGEKLELDQLLRDLDLFNEPQNDEKSPSNNQEITKEPLNRENQLENDLELLFGKVQQEQEEHLDRNEQIINEEKNLFQRIFTSYIDSEPKESPENILKGINQPTFRSSRIHSVSEKIRDDVFTMTDNALSATLDYIQSLPTSQEVTEFLLSTLDRWLAQDSAAKNDGQVQESIYLNKILNSKGKRITESHTKFIDKVKATSESQPEKPSLNIFTLPILFNKCIARLSASGDGVLAFTIFNRLKSHIHIYTICCNQKTFNEMMKIAWVNTMDLYTVEKLYFEMVGNGFTGDYHTFHILKSIIVEYYGMKMGTMNSPIWSRQDDIRVESLEKKLATLAWQLQ